MNTRTIRQFDLWTAHDCLGTHGRRPVIILSTEEDANTITVIPLTSNRESTQLPTHVLLSEQGLDRTSRALCERVTTIHKAELIRRIGCIYEPYDRFALRHALAVHLGLQAEEGTQAWD